MASANGLIFRRNSILSSKLVANQKPGSKPKTDRETLRKVFLGDLNKIFYDRWGPTFPEGDDWALMNLEILLRFHALHPTHGRERMKNCIETRAPWMSEEQAQVYLDDYASDDPRRLWPYRLELVERVHVSDADRVRLGAWRIPPFDVSEELEQQQKDRKRARDTVRRRKAGAKPRSIYLGDSKSRSEPWKRAGVSRSTYYRRGMHLTQTSPRHMLASTISQPLNCSQSPGRGRTETSPRHGRETLSSADLSHDVNETGTERKRA
jgi:hypothetical protein